MIAIVSLNFKEGKKNIGSVELSVDVPKAVADAAVDYPSILTQWTASEFLTMTKLQCIEFNAAKKKDGE